MIRPSTDPSRAESRRSVFLRAHFAPQVRVAPSGLEATAGGAEQGAVLSWQSRLPLFSVVPGTLPLFALRVCIKALHSVCVLSLVPGDLIDFHVDQP